MERAREREKGASEREKEREREGKKEREKTVRERERERETEKEREKEKAVELAKEKGYSSWLNGLPNAEHGFDQGKAAPRDAVSLRYGWEMANLPSTCSLVAHFDSTHALQCPTGGFTMTRHNEGRDILSDSLRDVPR